MDQILREQILHGPKAKWCIYFFF